MGATLEIERRPLGRSTLAVPRISLGCGNFGGVGSAPELFGQGLSDEQALELLDAAWELGITHFDTADAYGGGRSERAIGRWIRSRGQRPMLTTKTFYPMDRGQDHGLEPSRIRRQLESSLERLGVECIDLYLAHDFDVGVPFDETLGAFEELLLQGKVRAYGVSNFGAAQLEAAESVQAVQNNYSLLERGDESSVLPLCRARGIAYIAYSPLCGGWLTGKYRRGQAFPAGSRMTQRPDPYRELLSDRTFDALEELERFASDRGTSMAAVALAWLLADDRVTQLVSGPVAIAHLEPVREALLRPLTVDERAHLDAVFAR